MFNVQKTFSSGAYNETKYDNLARSMAMMEDELNRTDDRVKVAESRVVDVEAELQNIGNNQKQFEVSEEKARQREDFGLPAILEKMNFLFTPLNSGPFWDISRTFQKFLIISQSSLQHENQWKLTLGV